MTKHSTPICMVEGDFSAILKLDELRTRNIPTFYDSKSHTLYTDTEENAERARYVLLKDII